MELREAYGRVKRRIEGPKEYRDSTGRPTESTNLDHQPKSKHRLDFGPCTYVVDEQLDLYTGPPKLESLLPACLWIPCP